MAANQDQLCEILLVEDNPGDIMLVEEALSESGMNYNLHTIRNGSDVLDYLKNDSQHIPDLMLLDLNLPRKNGKEILQEIKDDETLGAIPVIVLTTSDAESDIYSCYKLKANCYISKPADYEHFSEIVKYVKEFWGSIAKLPSRHMYNG